MVHGSTRPPGGLNVSVRHKSATSSLPRQSAFSRATLHVLYRLAHQRDGVTLPKRLARLSSACETPVRPADDRAAAASRLGGRSDGRADGGWRPRLAGHQRDAGRLPDEIDARAGDRRRRIAGARRHRRLHLVRPLPADGGSGEPALRRGHPGRACCAADGRIRVLQRLAGARVQAAHFLISKPELRSRFAAPPN